LIERAFAANSVDEQLIDLEDVQVLMGLKAERDTPREPLFPFPAPLEKPAALPPSSKKLEKAKKSKRKQANKSRKINRKKKK
jgi:hypothetical protein